jgi:hypothetical protein
MSGSSRNQSERGSTGAVEAWQLPETPDGGAATPCVVCYMPVPPEAHSRVCSPECREIEYGPRVGGR